VEEAHRKAWRHAGGSANVECGGILVGHPFQTPDKEISFIVIVDVIFQDSDNRSVGHFTVSPAEVAESRMEIERKGYFAVGWYHSHPGHGVFLSGHDMIIVRSIYNANWHVAWVIDPLRDEEAFFQGAEGKELSGHYKLKKEPEFVKASAFFTKAEEAWQFGDERINEAKRRFEQLKVMLDDPKLHLTHWRDTGRYQIVENALRQLSVEEEPVSYEKASPSHLNSQNTGDVESNDSYNLMKIPERYDQAEVFLRDALREQLPELDAISNAWQILTWIKEKSPEYKETERLIYYSERIKEILGSPYRRLSLEEERELEELSRFLRQLL